MDFLKYYSGIIFIFHEVSWSNLVSGKWHADVFDCSSNHLYYVEMEKNRIGVNRWVNLLYKIHTRIFLSRVHLRGRSLTKFTKFAHYWLPNCPRLPYLVRHSFTGVIRKNNFQYHLLNYGSQEIIPFWCRCSILLGPTFVEIKNSFTKILLSFNSKNFRIICYWKKSGEDAPI